MLFRSSPDALHPRHEQCLLAQLSMPSAYVARRSRDLNKLATMSTVPFQLYVWPQRLLMLAPAYASAQHRHHTAQIAFGLNGPFTLVAVAKAMHRSSSRFAHRFSAATGLPLRRYVLWCRLRTATAAAMRGASLTEAAHVAGFEDSAHLSRTFRAMFGVPPSLLFKIGQINVTFRSAAASS